MKRCPTCQTVYTDDSLSYCLQDGSKLAVINDSAAEATLQMGAGDRSFGSDAPPTEILRPEDMPTARIEQTPPTREQQRARATALSGEQAPPAAGGTVVVPARGSAPVVALSIVVALLLVTLGGLITWIMMRDNKAQTEQTRATSSNSTQNETRQSNTAPANSNANTAAAATPMPQASPSVDVAAAQKEVQALLNDWAGAVRQRNLEAHMKYYAGVLDVYYNATNVSRERVRNERDAAFSKYSSMDMQVSNVTIAVEPSGTRATATFDKTFEFRNDEKTFSGSGLNRFWFTKTGGVWRITGEKELKNYYVNK
jgi:ketosteroid isomerase-like protein